ncbi:hypothetical protein [Bacteroides sp. 224]|uniref:hypothetical protein n=1 Tax=Bacteroides sp. 224 TaxID=2302936 RepID=UPI0013D3E304|nr:hypothetical protein [Bacteroides sp. 224]NDV63983.1 hypothetical protein [Bacteroides sp. 224]
MKENTTSTQSNAPENPKNDVASFMYYMWNAWCRSECEMAFAGHDVNHLWSKWIGYNKHNERHGAVEEFFANLSDYYQDMLVKRATEVYNRRSRINENRE